LYSINILHLHDENSGIKIAPWKWNQSAIKVHLYVAEDLILAFINDILYLSDGQIKFFRKRLIAYPIQEPSL
jgi:hypothetical protein